MKIGLTMVGLRPDDYITVCQKADTLGYDLLMAADHLAPPLNLPSTYPYSATGEPPFTPTSPWLDPIVVLSYMAAATKRIKLATSIYILPLRHPISTARAAATLDLLSGGRLLLGAGTGWLREEFEAVDQGFDDRGKRTDEIVEIMKRLWTETTVEHRGEHYSFGPMSFEPKPVQKPHLPIHFGGETKVALRRAARLGDGWLGMGHSPESAQGVVRQLTELRREYGREKESFEITVQSATVPTVEDLQRFAEAGVHRVRAAVWGRGPGVTVTEMVAALERFAEQVMARL